jgi:hypothetical protein
MECFSCICFWIPQPIFNLLQCTLYHIDPCVNLLQWGCLQYYKILRSRRVPAKLLSYPDATHGLADKPSVEADSLINSVLWIAEHSLPPMKL